MLAFWYSHHSLCFNSVRRPTPLGQSIFTITQGLFLMTRIITFLGKCWGWAIRPWQWLPLNGLRTMDSRALLVTHCPNASAEAFLETALSPTPQVVSPQLEAVHLQTTSMLEQLWNELNKVISPYMPADFPVEILCRRADDFARI